MRPLTIRRLNLLIAVLFVCAIITQAQSGRRSTTTAPATPSVSGPKTAEKAPAKAPKLHLILGIENRSPAVNVPYYLSDTVMENFVARLAQSADVITDATGRGMDRVEAVKRAKGEKEAYVVWLQIESDIVNSDKQQKNGPDELHVNYTIFEPVNARVKQSGRTHQQIYKTGRGGVSTTAKNGPLYSEYALKQAGREAAQKVLDAFEIRDGNDP